LTEESEQEPQENKDLVLPGYTSLAPIRDLGPEVPDVADVLHAEFVGQKVICDARVLGRSDRKALPKTINARCRRCGGMIEVDPATDEIMFGLYMKNAIVQVARYANFMIPDPCMDDRSHGMIDVGESEAKQDYRILKVDSTKASSNEPLYTTHLIGKRSPSDQERVIRFHAKVWKNPKTQNLELVASDFERLKDTRDSFEITEQDKSAWTKYFGRDKQVHLAIATGIKGKTREAGKLACALSSHSVTEILDLHDRHIVHPGVVRAVLIGGTAVGKTDTARSFSDAGEDSGGHAYSKYVNAECASRTGMAYAIDSEAKMIIWGELVLNDRGMVVLDALDKFGEDELGQLREVLRRGHVTVTRLLKGDAPARTRIVATANPGKNDVEDFPYAIQALDAVRCFNGDPTEYTRWDIFVPYRRDVPHEVIATHERVKTPVPSEIWERHVFWAQTRKPEDILYDAEAVKEIASQIKFLLDEYESRNYPLVNNGIPLLLTKLSVAFACLNHSVDQTHEKVLVKKEAVQDAVAYLVELLKAWELDRYLSAVERPSAYQSVDCAAVFSEFNEVDWVILAQLSEGPKNATELETSTGLKAQTLRADHFKKLIERGLIGEGYAQKKMLTVKGAHLVRGIESALGPLPRGVDVLNKTQQETLDKNTGVEKRSTSQHPSEGTPLDQEGHLANLVKDYNGGMTSPVLEEKYGSVLLEHARSRGIIPKTGGRPE